MVYERPLRNITDNNGQTIDGREYLKKFLLDILETRYVNLGFAPQDLDDNHLVILGRKSATKWMCAFDYEDCTQKAENYFNNWMNSDKMIPADIKDTVFNTAVKNGNETHWNFVHQQFKNTKVDSDRQKYLNAMSSTLDPILLGMLLCPAQSILWFLVNSRFILGQFRSTLGQF